MVIRFVFRFVFILLLHFYFLLVANTRSRIEEFIYADVGTSNIGWREASRILPCKEEHNGRYPLCPLALVTIQNHTHNRNQS